MTLTFELGRLLAERGDFVAAIPHLSEAAAQFLSEGRGRDYLECQNLLLKVYTEYDDERAVRVKEEIQDLVLKGRLELDAKTFYSLAFCASHRGQQGDAIDYLHKSIGLAVEAQHHEDLAYALFGLASAYSRCSPPRSSEAWAELDKLEPILESIALPQVTVSARMLRAHLLLEQRRFDEALQFCWRAQEALVDSKSAVMGVYLMAFMAAVYLEKGDLTSARIHYALASRSVDRQNFRRLARSLDHSEARLAALREPPFDLKLDLENQLVTERKLGPVDLRNQHVLLELLRLFSAKPGRVYSKEELVEKVWQQDYDPGSHDNKVYVTIKRLRKFIEPDGDQPRYIIRAKDGYYLSSTARVVQADPSRGEE